MYSTESKEGGRGDDQQWSYERGMRGCELTMRRSSVAYLNLPRRPLPLRDPASLEGSNGARGHAKEVC